MLTPSRGFCATPFTDAGIARPTASRRVGTRSTTWCHWERMPPLSWIRAGQEITMPFRVPP